jgi:hypothetical protein
MQNVAGLFRTWAEAERALGALQATGVSRDDISLMARQGVVPEYADVDMQVAEGAAVGASSGAVAGGLGGLLVGLGLVTIPGIGPVLAAGTLATALATTAAGAGLGAAAGGVLGGLAGLGVPREDVELYAEGVKRGGVLLSANVNDERVGEARNILSANGAIDIRQSASQWRQTGWTGYQDSAPYNDNYPPL